MNNISISQACSDSKSRPGFLTDKALDPAIKVIVKKFPVTDTKVYRSFELPLVYDTFHEFKFTTDCYFPGHFVLFLFRVCSFSQSTAFKMKFSKVSLTIITHLWMSWNSE